MTVFNNTPTSAISDPFGKTAQTFMNKVLSTKAIDEDKISKLVDSRCKKKTK